LGITGKVFLTTALLPRTILIFTHIMWMH